MRFLPKFLTKRGPPSGPPARRGDGLRSVVPVAPTQSERRFRDFAEASADSLWETDAELRYTWFHNSGRQFPNTPDRPEMIGKRRGDYLETLGTDRDAWRVHLQDLENRRPFRHFQFSGTYPDGRVFHRLSSGIPFYDTDGRFAGYRGTTSDITDRVLAEHDANVARDRLLSFTTAASDTLWETDAEHRLVWMSDPERAGARYQPKSRMIGRRRWEFSNVEPPDSPLWRKHIDDLENRRPFRDFEFATMLDNGNTVHRRVSGHPIFDGAGKFAGYRGVSSDITDRVLAEQAARADQQRLLGAFEATDQGIALFDADDILLFVNRAFNELQTLPPEIFVPGRTFAQIFADSSRVLSDLPEMSEAWIERRLQYHRNPVGAFATIRVKGRHIEVRDERLPDGGSLVRLTDVTAQTEARKALERSQSRFRDFAEASSDWHWETDADFRFVWHTADSDPAETQGRPATGQTPWEFQNVDVEKDESFQRHIETLLAREPFRGFRHRKTLADGSIAYRSASGLPYFSDDGQFLGYRGTTTDVTAQVRAEQRYRDLIEQMPAPVIVHRRDLILFANSAALDMFGASSAAEVVGRSILDFVHPDDREQFVERMSATMDDGVVTELSEQRRVRLDGSEIFVITRGVPVVWEGARAVLGTQIDITARVNAEGQYRELIESAPMPISIDDGKVFLFANQAFADLMAAGDAAAVVGRPVTDMAHPDDIDDFLERVRLVTDLRQTLPTAELKRRRFNGETITVLNRGVPIQWAGRPARLGIQIDISDRIEAQDAVRDSEERFRNLVEGSRQGVLLHWDFKPVFANAALADIFGYESADEILELESILALVAPEEIEMWREYRDARLEGLQAPDSYEFAGLRKDGSRIWLQITVRVVAWQGRTALQGTMIDVTEQRAAVEAIRDREERFRVLTAMSPVGIFLTDADGNCEYVNEAYQNMTGYTANDAAGQGWANALHPDDRERVASGWAQTVSGNRPFRMEYRYLRPDGSIVWAIGQAAAQRDMSGRIVGYIGAVTDVTANRETRKALESSEERFRMLALLSPVGVFLTDADGAVEYVNDSLARMLGMPAHAARGREWVNGIHPGDRRKLRGAWNDAVKRRADMEIEIRLGHAGKGDRWAIVQASPLRTPGGAVSGYVGAVTDITDRRVAEEQMRQVQKMDAVGQLTGGIAHDFNNLLAIVQGNLELLRERAPEEKRLQSLIEAAHGAARRGAMLNQRLLAFARRQPLRPETCNINQIVKDMAGLFVRTLGDHIDLETSFAAGLWRARVDPNGLETAVLNLAINARDAMPDGGRLIIGTANVVFDAGRPAPAKELREGAYVQLRVTDTGTGMDPETIDRAFDPFFTTKVVGKGSGLGLSMVYGFAHQSGGHVTIESVQGHGTSITLYFPRTDEEQPVRSPAMADTPPAGHGERILVVDDDADVRRMAVDMFASLNYRTVEAASAEEALRVLEDRQDIALLFTDVMLGDGENGPGLARRARGKHPGIRILFTSGYTMGEFEDGKAIELGALVSKPYERHHLARAVKAALQTGRA